MSQQTSFESSSASAFAPPRFAPRRAREELVAAGSTFAPRGKPPRTVEEVASYVDRFEELSGRAHAFASSLRSALGYLSANAIGWTYTNRDRLRIAIASKLDATHVRLVTEFMAANPKTEALDASEHLLRSASEDVRAETASVADDVTLLASVRARLLGAVARSSVAPCAVLLRHLDDGEPEVRAAAAELIGELEVADLVTQLERRLGLETSDLVKQTIQESLTALR